MKLMCKLFGHKWGCFSLIPEQVFCKRCGIDKEPFIEKWLDKHMD
ncbi:DUF1660 family phage protein [Lactococcus lactis]